MTPVNSLSLAAVYIRLLFGETVLAKASAFLWKHDGKSFLISNWHNFSGRKPIIVESDDSQTISPTGAVPDRVECVFYRNRLSGGQRVDGAFPYSDTFPLIDHSGPLYVEHPFSSRVDIAALPIELHAHVTPHYLNEYEFDEDVELYAGQDVSIIGYPFGLVTHSPFPIWKRGTIASEPPVPIDGLHKVWIPRRGPACLDHSLSPSTMACFIQRGKSPSLDLQEDCWVFTRVVSGQVSLRRSLELSGIVKRSTKPCRKANERELSSRFWKISDDVLIRS